jgi:signal peptidase I
MAAMFAGLISRIGAFFLDMIETLVISLSIFLIVYLFIVQPHQVNGQSMVPTFQSGEYVLSDKVSYRTRDPQRGEVIVFHAPEAANCPKGTGCDFIKRVIAVPGETIELKDNHYIVNGVIIEESYIPPEYQTLPGNATRGKTISLQDGEFFVSGDNRPYSADSRAWGPITKNDIVGRVIFRYWPLNVMGRVNKATYPQEP